MSSDTKVAALELLRQGWPPAIVATELDLNPNTVRGWASKKGYLNGRKKSASSKKDTATSTARRLSAVPDDRGDEGSNPSAGSNAQRGVGRMPESAGGPGSTPGVGSTEIRTRKCMNRDCNERFVPVNGGHFFHHASCRLSDNLWTKEEIFAEEASLLPTAHPLEMAQRAFAQKNQVVRKLQSAISLREYLRHEVRALHDEMPELRFTASSVPGESKSKKKSPRQAVLLLSDWQVGKLENGIGVKVMQEQRLPRILNATRHIVEHFRASGYPLDDLHVQFIGDMIEGCYIYGGQNVTGLDKTSNTHRITRQIAHAAQMQANVVADIASYVRYVFVHSVPGNHGRPNGRNDFADPEDNFDTLAAEWAEDKTHNLKNVVWDITENWWGGFNLWNQQLVALHGDQWNGPLQRIETLLPQWALSGAFGKPNPTVVLLGHRHDFAHIRVNGVHVVQNGTIDGGSNWYQRAYGKASPPTQTLLIFSESHGLESVYPIYF